MRGMVLLAAVGIVSGVLAAEPDMLSFDMVVQRATADAALLARTAVLAHWEREVAATGRLTREGPTLEAEIGPRRMDYGGHKVQAAARIEVPFLSGRRARADADSRLRDTAPDLLAADAVESRLRLRVAYLDAWLEQERLQVIDAQVQVTERLAESVRKRVEEGAGAPYEAALVDGEMLRLRSESDGARVASGEAWAALRALADVPSEPAILLSPGPPDLSVPEDPESRFEEGLLRRAIPLRGSLENAFLELEHAQRRSRWSAAATLAKEADESYATAGVSYRFPHRVEADALSRERATAAAAIDRTAGVEASRLETRFATVIERARRFGPITPPDAFDDALRAVALRMELGKEPPSLALPVRRQLLEARGAALRRVRDAHVLHAELDALLAGEAP